MCCDLILLYAVQRNESLEEYDVQMDEHGDGQKESVSVLRDYSEGSMTPWLADYDWSSEAQTVRELSMKSPHVFKDPDIIYKYFKTLRILGKEVLCCQCNDVLVRDIPCTESVYHVSVCSISVCSNPCSSSNSCAELME